MKKVILLLIATVAGLSCFAEKTYTMTLADENNPGKMISYNIVEPLFKDNNNNFIGRMYNYMKSPNLVEKRKNLNSVGVTSRGSDETNIVGDVVHTVGAELAVIEALHHVVDIQAVLGLGGGFHVPDDQFFSQRLGHGLSQHGLAGAGFAFD